MALGVLRLGDAPVISISVSLPASLNLKTGKSMPGIAPSGSARMSAAELGWATRQLVVIPPVRLC